MGKNEFRFALAGNPNSGKTTLFNELTGSHYEVGNWAGVTVERKEGICKFAYHNHDTGIDTHEHDYVHKHEETHHHIRIVDLPGIYSLSPYSAEEVITKNYIQDENPDLILNIADATNLSRNLYLTTQLMEMEKPMIVALNMMDALEANGCSIDVGVMSELLGVKVLPISASKGTGMQDLVNEALRTASDAKPAKFNINYGDKIEGFISRIKELEKIPRLSCIKLLEQEETEAGEKTREIIKQAISELGDIKTKIAEIRYREIRKVVEAATARTGENKQEKITDKIDHIATHPVFAIPVFGVIMLLIFQVTFGSLGSLLSDLFNYLVNVKFYDAVSAMLAAAGAGKYATGLVLDGIISGVGGVITFFPQIMLLFLFLSFLEDSGYMARTAFIMDKLFVKMGLSGKSFVPMIMGFGCTVPAIMSARTLDNEKDRKLTALLTPFMSCGAKMPVYAIITAALFPNNAGIVIFSLYFIGVLLAICSGFILSRTILKGEAPPFILELPPYRMPTFKSTFHHMWEKAKDFAVRAGTVLLAASIIIWFLQNLSFSFKPVADSTDSMIGVIGRFVAPIFTPCGFGTPEAAVSLVSGFAAKEAVISTMSILYEVSESAQLAGVLSQIFTPASAYSFLVFVLLYTPCIAAVTTLKKELNSWRLTLFSIGYQICIAWCMSAIVYNIARLII